MIIAEFDLVAPDKRILGTLQLHFTFQRPAGPFQRLAGHNVVGGVAKEPATPQTFSLVDPTIPSRALNEIPRHGAPESDRCSIHQAILRKDRVRIR